MKLSSLCLLLSVAVAGADPGSSNNATQNVEAYSRVFHHNNGTRTESRKDGTKNEIHELTYNANNVLQSKRIYITDSKGRTRRGIIYDGRMNPVGSIEYGYDPSTNQILLERLYNNKAQLMRILFYPGSLKEARFANQFVAFSYDPNNPNAKPVQSRDVPKPTKPVESDNDDGFNVGEFIGSAAPPANRAAAAPAASGTAAASTATQPPRRSFLPRRK